MAEADIEHTVLPNAQKTGTALLNAGERDVLTRSSAVK